jgi:CRP/FNR family transcriptional regulator
MMANANVTLNNRSKDIKSLCSKYHVLEKVDKKNNGVISEQAYFRTLYVDENIEATEGTCLGMLFVLKGIVRQYIIKDNQCPYVEIVFL